MHQFFSLSLKNRPPVHSDETSILYKIAINKGKKQLEKDAWEHQDTPAG